MAKSIRQFFFFSLSFSHSLQYIKKYMQLGYRVSHVLFYVFACSWQHPHIFSRPAPRYKLVHNFLSQANIYRFCRYDVETKHLIFGKHPQLDLKLWNKFSTLYICILTDWTRKDLAKRICKKSKNADNLRKNPILYVAIFNKMQRV